VVHLAVQSQAVIQVCDAVGARGQHQFVAPEAVFIDDALPLRVGEEVAVVAFRHVVQQRGALQFNRVRAHRAPQVQRQVAHALRVVPIIMPPGKAHTHHVPQGQRFLDQSLDFGQQ
jgi:hypothetical protein